MHYYRHHIGDMIKDTAHLSNEHLAVYMRMIWKYYQDEKGFADECENLAFALRSDEKTVRLLLNYYFKLIDGIWTHTRCERELVGLYAKSDAARSSAKARWRDKDLMQKPCERIEPASLNHADAPKIDATQLPSNPVTQLPNKKTEEEMAVVSSAKLPPCQHSKILELFNVILPTLPQPRPELWAGSKNEAALSARWRWLLSAKKAGGQAYATNSEEALDWFGRFFKHVSLSDFLMGRTPKPFACTLAWLINASNFAKVIEGNYDQKTAS